MSTEVVEDTTSNYAVGSTQDLDIGGHIDGIYPGLNISYEGDSGLGITLSLGGLIGNRMNYYNDLFYGGMEIGVYSLTVTYKM